MSDEISTAEAVNALEQLGRAFRGLQKAEQLIKAVATADGRIAEQDQQIRAADATLAELHRQIDGAREEAQTAETASAIAIVAARQRVADAEAKASADIVAINERRTRELAERERVAAADIEALDGLVSARRAELAGLDRKIADANAALASLRAKLG